jgi:putative ABC transport system substrate-binding protein
MRRREFITFVGGSVAAWPVAARAQPTKKYRMIILSVTSDLNFPTVREFFRELSRLGYTEGKTLEVELLSTNGNSELREEIARKAAREMPDVIFVITGPLTKSVKDVSGTIPIACMTADPIALGLTTSLAKPSGNVTGVVVDGGIEGWGKKLQLLKEVAPTANRIGFLARQAVWHGTETPAVVRAVRAAAETIGFELIGVPVASPMQEAQYRSALKLSRLRKLKHSWFKMLRNMSRFAKLLLTLLRRQKFRRSTLFVIMQKPED